MRSESPEIFTEHMNIRIFVYKFFVFDFFLVEPHSSRALTVKQTKWTSLNAFTLRLVTKFFH